MSALYECGYQSIARCDHAQHHQLIVGHSALDQIRKPLRSLLSRYARQAIYRCKEISLFRARDTRIESIPVERELDVKEIISMVRSLLDIPSKYKSNPRDIVYNTVALHDDQKKQDYFYDAYSFRENPHWKTEHEYSVLSRIGPMISAFERNTLKLLYQTWDHHKKNEIIMDRLRRMYKIVLCLEFTPVLSVLDPTRFVQEALDMDEDHPDFPQAVQRVQDIEILDTCHRIYASAREDVKDDKDDIHNDVIGIQKKTRRITTAASKIIHKIFQHECVSNPDFLHKMNHVNENASAAASGGDVLEKYDVKYTSI